MAILKVLNFPDPRLRVKAAPVKSFDAEVKQIVEDMFETMYAENGVGLAATQVGIDKRIFVMDVSPDRNERYCVINPVITAQSGEQTDSEGCLSVEGAFDKVTRAANVTLEAFDVAGKPYSLQATELMAACIQHEIDHLNGILFIDHLSKLKQERIRKKIAKLHRA